MLLLRRQVPPRTGFRCRSLSRDAGGQGRPETCAHRVDHRPVLSAQADHRSREDTVLLLGDVLAQQAQDLLQLRAPAGCGAAERDVGQDPLDQGCARRPAPGCARGARGRRPGTDLPPRLPCAARSARAARRSSGRQLPGHRSARRPWPGAPGPGRRRAHASARRPLARTGIRSSGTLKDSSARAWSVRRRSPPAPEAKVLTCGRRPGPRPRSLRSAGLLTGSHAWMSCACSCSCSCTCWRRPCGSAVRSCWRRSCRHCEQRDLTDQAPNRASDTCT